MTAELVEYDVVVPTLGRPELADLLAALDRRAHPRPRRIVIVDDRSEPAGPLLPGPPPPGIAASLRLISSGGRGPAAARNLGWKICRSPWVVFLDDDVVPGVGWGEALSADLGGAAPKVVGVQGKVSVPRDSGRCATDWERNVAGLETADWITADMAYRRWALEMLGGFDERFHHAYREDTDLALRTFRGGLHLAKGARRVWHPVRKSPPFASIGRQRGNADDVLMSLVHGRGWRRRAGIGRGKLPAHLLTTLTAATALQGAVGRNRRKAVGFAAVWLFLVGVFAWSRIRPGPRTAMELLDMTVTSVAVPFAATWHWVRGWSSTPLALAAGSGGPRPVEGLRAPIEAVLFDRDGTLIQDVPYNGDPSRVVPMPAAREAVHRLRRWGLALGVITNQSGVGRRLITGREMGEVNRAVERALGPFDVWAVCAHHPGRGCRCRKPEPGLILQAAAELGVSPERCVVIGDIGSDVEAARRAGASHILVPTAATMPEEIHAAANLAADLAAAVDQLGPLVEGVR